ncbi:MAG: DUF6506 family protein [Saccharofermentanales bacterium]|jgi:hypothetical protein
MSEGIVWAFIFLSEGSDPKKHQTQLEHCGNTLLVYGVNTLEEGCEVAKEIVENKNCTLIELCGGFKREGAARVRKAVGSKALVGYIDYFEADLLNM